VVNVVPPPGTEASALDVAIPAGWRVLAVHDGGAWDEVHRKVKWGPFLGDGAIKVQFEVRLLPIAAQRGKFIGTASFDGVNQQFQVRSESESLP